MVKYVKNSNVIGSNKYRTHMIIITLSSQTDISAMVYSLGVGLTTIEEFTVGVIENLLGVTLKKGRAYKI